MKKTLAMAFMVSTATIIFSSPSLAGDMFGYFKDKQDKALPAIIDHCLLKGDDAACAVSIRDLVQAEMGMVSYGKNYLDDDLFCRLSNDLGELQYREFAFRVFKERLRMNHCGLEPAGSVFP